MDSLPTSRKTRLALKAAEVLRDGQPDGAFFVDLSALRDPALVPLAITQALRLGVDPGGDALHAALAYLRDREALLLVDNFEQVVEAANVVEELLAAASRLRVLVTSRSPLGIYGERELELPPFEVPADASADLLSASPAIALFVDRA